VTLTLSVLRCPDAVPPETKRVSGGEFRIGRGPDNDWIMPDPDRMLSKKHCVVAFRNGGWAIADTSTNGTFLNRDSDPIGNGQIRGLQDGDRIRFGAYEIEVRIEQESSFAQPRPGAAFGSSQSSPFDDPFGDDVFATRPPPPETFTSSAFGNDPLFGGPSPKESVNMPTRYDPMAPPTEEDFFANPTVPDHSPSFNDAFRPPPTAPKLIPDDDWDLGLPGVPTPVTSPRPTPQSFSPQPLPPQVVPPPQPFSAPPPPATFAPPPQPDPFAAPAETNPYAAPPQPVAYPAPPQPAPYPAPPQPVPYATPPQPVPYQPAAAPPPGGFPGPQATFSPGPPPAAPAAYELPPAMYNSPFGEPAVLPPALPPPIIQPPTQAAPAALSPFAEPEDYAPPSRPAPPPTPPQAATQPALQSVQPQPAQSFEPQADNALLAAFLAGAGMTTRMPENPTATMKDLGAAFRAVVSGIRQALIARSSIKGEFRIEQTMIRARGNNPLKFSADDDDALSAMLGVGRRIDVTPEAAIADALRDMRLHELATVAAMQGAVRTLLAGLDPAKLLADATGGMLPAQKRAKAFDAYEKLHETVTRALADDFDSVFGKAFARAYETALRDISAKEPS
jgi:type VI secretion system FHA domain protein